MISGHGGCLVPSKNTTDRYGRGHKIFARSKACRTTKTAQKFVLLKSEDPGFNEAMELNGLGQIVLQHVN